MNVKSKQHVLLKNTRISSMFISRMIYCWKKLLYAFLWKMLDMQMNQTVYATAPHYVGNYSYQDVVSFLLNENRCSFLPWELPFIIGKKQAKSEKICLIHTSLVKDVSSKAEITKVQFKYFATDINKSFEQSFSNCITKRHLQTMELRIRCEGRIVGLLMNEPCLEEQLCTGTEDVQKCTSRQNKFESFCRCNANYVELSTKCSKNSECQVVKEEQTFKCRKEEREPCLFTALGLVFCIITCSLLSFMAGLKIRNINPKRDTTITSHSEDSNEDRNRAEVNSHNSLDNPAENTCQASASINDFSDTHIVRKQPKNDACALNPIEQKRPEMLDDIYIEPLSMSFSSSSTEEQEYIYDELYQEKGDGDTENIYDNSIRHCQYRDHHSDNDTYDHLHQEQTPFSTNVYGVADEIPVSALNQQDKSHVENGL